MNGKLTGSLKQIEFIYSLINILFVFFPMCRNPLPEPVQSILEEGIDLYKLHTKRHGRSILRYFTWMLENYYTVLYLRCLSV